MPDGVISKYPFVVLVLFLPYVVWFPASSVGFISDVLFGVVSVGPTGVFSLVSDISDSPDSVDVLLVTSVVTLPLASVVVLSDVSPLLFSNS